MSSSLVLNSFSDLEPICSCSVVRSMRPFSAFYILLCNCLHENACDDLFIEVYVKSDATVLVNVLWRLCYWAIVVVTTIALCVLLNDEQRTCTYYWCVCYTERALDDQLVYKYVRDMRNIHERNDFCRNENNSDI